MTSLLSPAGTLSELCPVAGDFRTEDRDVGFRRVLGGQSGDVMDLAI
jgi:hypothetical protein